MEYENITKGIGEIRKQVTKDYLNEIESRSKLIGLREEMEHWLYSRGEDLPFAYKCLTSAIYFKKS